MCTTHLFILLYLSVKFDQIRFIGLRSIADTQFVSGKPLTFDCDLDIGRGNLNYVRDTPSHFALSFCEVC